MQKTDIEWVINKDGSRGFSANPVRGRCPHFGTSTCGTYCYAESFRIRNKWPEELSFHVEVLDAIARRKKPATIFMGSMIDLWADAIYRYWQDAIIETMRHAPQHTYLLCTKNPNFYYYDEFSPPPSNIWFGASITTVNQASTFSDTMRILRSKGYQTFFSAEPLMEDIAEYIDMEAISKIIIGAMTGKNPILPQRQWVEKIIEKANKAGIEVFVKNNLIEVYRELSPRWKFGGW
jgi:protein gp37